jgi:rhodanese-related sulfurtransferase
MDYNQKEWTEAAIQLGPKNAIVLDVRTPGEWEEGVLETALKINFLAGQGFVDEVKQLDKSKHYFVVCRSGQRSAKACAIMKDLGFDKLYNLVGGMNGWEGTKKVF